MSKRGMKIIFVFALIVLLLPALGISQSWKNVFLVLAGLTIAGISGLALRRLRVPRRQPETFEENGGGMNAPSITQEPEGEPKVTNVRAPVELEPEPAPDEKRDSDSDMKRLHISS